MELPVNNWDRRIQYQFENIEVKGYFSVDSSSSMIFDCSQMRYYLPPQKETVFINLHDGIRDRECYQQTSEGENFENMMRWIKKNHKIIQASPESGRWLQPNFVLRHAVLVKLLEAQLEKSKQWIICAVKYKGTIYLYNFDTERQAAYRQNLRLTSWKAHRDRKFTQNFVSDSANTLPTTDSRRTGNTQFQCIFQSHLANHVLLYSAEVDAVCSDKCFKDPLPLNELKFIKLTTTQMRDVSRQMIFEKYRTFGWWCASYALGIRKLLCGFIHGDHIVKQLRTFTINDLLEMSGQYWNPSVSINFCNTFLTYVANTVVDDWNQTVYKFEKIPHGNIEMTELLPFSEYSFLPEWYTRDTAEYNESEEYSY